MLYREIIAFSLKIQTKKNNTPVWAGRRIVEC